MQEIQPPFVKVDMKLLAVDYAGADHDDTCWIVDGLWPIEIVGVEEVEVEVEMEVEEWGQKSWEA